MELRPRAILAPNASPMTMGGTITYLVGRDDVVVIDPGSAAASHLEAIAAEVGGARRSRVLLTHAHPDHATGARELARKLDTRVYSLATGTLQDCTSIATDEGDVIALATPGHSPDHAAFHWPAARAVFCGDLMMGGQDTAVVAAPEGDLGEYLASLERLRALAPAVIYPAHGPPFTEPSVAIDRYVAHRVERERQVLAALRHGAHDVPALTDAVYGDDLDPALRPFAEAAVKAYVAHLLGTGRWPEDASD
jgi:glyoxylase-like metal-dependent hydrolase (beta-lactamase superfamily II)